MKNLGRLLRNRWAVPVTAAVVIAAALISRWGLGHLGIGDALMVAAGIIAGARIVTNAMRALANRIVGIDLLVGVAAVGAVVIGEYWEAAAVTFLFAFGHALESATLERTRSALSELVAVAPQIAVVLRGSEQAEVPAGSVRRGETVLVKNGEKVPVDGVVIAGTGSVDEASITGESIPVDKTTDDRVFAGTVSRGGFLQVRATGVGADTTLARIIHRVEEAQDAKASTARFMDRFARWYTPAVMVGALAAWFLTGDVVLALTLLVIGCPGALVISIPVSVVAGIGRAARDGILIEGGEYLETAGRIDTVAVDKTGTLTQGRPRVVDVVPLAEGVDRDRVLALAAGAEAGSEHPLAAAVLDAAEQAGVGTPGVPDQTEPVPGKGIAAMVNGEHVLVGNAALLEHFGVPDNIGAARIAEAIAAGGRTPMIVAHDHRPVGVAAVADTLRSAAPEMVRRLHAAGVDNVIMLTGDAAPVAEAVAAATGIDQVHASLLPEDKLAVVTELQRQGHTVAMVGDGVNDAPALAAADIGVAMGAAGSAVAIETADIALMADDLLKLPEAVALSRRTVANMGQNIAAAIGTTAVLLAGVLAGGVTMAIGMLVHQASVLAVIANAMRLLRPVKLSDDVEPPGPVETTGAEVRTERGEPAGPTLEPALVR